MHSRKRAKRKIQLHRRVSPLLKGLISVVKEEMRSEKEATCKQTCKQENQLATKIHC